MNSDYIIDFILSRINKRIPAGLWIYDLNKSEFIFVSSRVAEIFDVPIEDITDDKFSLTDYVLKEDVNKLVAFDIDTPVAEYYNGQYRIEVGGKIKKIHSEKSVHNFRGKKLLIGQIRLEEENPDEILASLDGHKPYPYLKLFQDSSFPIIIFDKDNSNILFSNSELNENLHYDKDELLKLKIEDVDTEISNYGLNNNPNPFESLFKKGYTKMRRKDGSHVNFRSYHFLAQYNKRDCIVRITTDISFSEKRKQKLTTQIDKFIFDLLDKVDVGFFYVNDDLEILYASEYVVRLSRKKREELIGANLVEVFNYDSNPNYERNLRIVVNEKFRKEFSTYFEPIGKWIEIGVTPTIDGAFISVKDISEQKSYKSQLIETQNNLLSLLDNTNDLIWSINRDIELLTFNKAFEEYVKQRYNHDIKIGESPLSLKADSEVLIKWSEFYKRALNGEMFKERVHLKINGKEIEFELSFNPISDSTNTYVIGVGCFARSLEKINIQNEKIKELSLVASRTHNSILLTNSQGEVTWVNNSFTKMTGYELEDVIGKVPSEFLHGPETNESTLKKNKRLMEKKEPFRSEIIAYKKNNTPFWLEVEMTPVIGDDGEVEKYISIQSDITTRKKRIAEIEKLSLVASRTHNMVIITDKEGKTEWVNKSFERNTGYSLNDMIGKKPGELLQGEKTDKEEVSRISKLLKKKKGFNSKLLNYKKSGEIFWISMDISPVFDSNEELVNYVAIQNDITNEKKQQERIKELGDIIEEANVAIIVRDLDNKIELWNKGAERMFGMEEIEVKGKNIFDIIHYKNSDEVINEKLLQLKKQGVFTGNLEFLKDDGSSRYASVHINYLHDEKGERSKILSVYLDITEKKLLEESLEKNQRLESIGTLASGIAHDLNNVLTPILLSAEIIEQTDIKSDILKKTNNIKESIKRGKNIVNQVLSFSRGAESSELMPVNIKTVFKEINVVVKETFSKSIKLTINYDEHLKYVKANDTKLYQVILNLILNAKDSINESGKITLNARNLTVDSLNSEKFPELAEGEYLEITCEDNGLGIKEEHIGKIFEPFFTTKKKGEGTGLGLYTTKNIINSYGGEINVKSEFGKGSIFKIHLPAIEEKSDETKPMIKEYNFSKNLEILIVEDEKKLAVDMQEILTKNNIKSEVIFSGYEVIPKIHKNPSYNLILLNENLPGINGSDNRKIIKELYPDIKFLMISGNPEQLPIEDNGVFALEKPFSGNELLSKIQLINNELFK